MRAIHRISLSVALTLSALPFVACSSSGSTGDDATAGASPSAGAPPGAAGTLGAQGGVSGAAPASGGAPVAGAASGRGGEAPTFGGGNGLAGAASAGAPAATGGASGRAGSGGGPGASAGASGVGGGATAGAPGTGGAGPAKPSTGCGKAAALMSGRASITVEGSMREYILALPNDYDAARPYRLIFGWHPLGGSAQQVASGGYYGLQNQSKGGAIFVAPEGLPFRDNSLGWGNRDGEDIAFLEAMLERFRADLCIDEDRIFSTGFSFGGMFSFASGCAMNGMMRAIAPMAGNIAVSGCQNGTRPVAVMGFHGVQDQVVAIDGGRAGRDKFVERNQCTEQTMPASPSWCDGLGQNNQPCECVSYQGCTPGYPVIWCEFKGSHTPAPSSAATIWNFFAQF